MTVPTHRVVSVAVLDRVRDLLRRSDCTCGPRRVDGRWLPHSAEDCPRVIESDLGRYSVDEPAEGAP
jgi:hypothetical protein